MYTESQNKKNTSLTRPDLCRINTRAIQIPSITILRNMFLFSGATFVVDLTHNDNITASQIDFLH